MRASRGLKWANKMYKLKRSINTVSVLLQVLILLTNDSTGSHGPQKGKLWHSARSLIDLGVKVVPVAIRDKPVVEDLENIASENRVIRTLLGDHIKLAKRLLKGTESSKYSSIIFRKCCRENPS